MNSDSPFGDDRSSGVGDHGDTNPLDDPTRDGKRFNWYGLRNDTPEVDVHDVQGSLALDVSWVDHLAAGFIKQSGGQGIEAWMHYTVAVVLYADETVEGGLLPDGDREDLEDLGNDDDGGPIHPGGEGP